MTTGQSIRESAADWLRAHPGRIAKMTGWTRERGWTWTDGGPIPPNNLDPVAWAQYNAERAAMPLEKKQHDECKP